MKIWWFSFMMLLFITSVVHADSAVNPLTKGLADRLYCPISNCSAVNITIINGSSLWDDKGSYVELINPGDDVRLDNGTINNITVNERLCFSGSDVCAVQGTATWLYFIGRNDPIGANPSRNLNPYNLKVNNVFELVPGGKLIPGYPDIQTYTSYNSSAKEVQHRAQDGYTYEYYVANVQLERSNLSVCDDQNHCLRVKYDYDTGAFIDFDWSTAASRDLAFRTKDSENVLTERIVLKNYANTTDIDILNSRLDMNQNNITGFGLLCDATNCESLSDLNQTGLVYNVTYNITNNITYNVTYNITNNITYNITNNITNNITTGDINGTSISVNTLVTNDVSYFNNDIYANSTQISTMTFGPGAYAANLGIAIGRYAQAKGYGVAIGGFSSMIHPTAGQLGDLALGVACKTNDTAGSSFQTCIGYGSMKNTDALATLIAANTFISNTRGLTIGAGAPGHDTWVNLYGEKVVLNGSNAKAQTVSPIPLVAKQVESDCITDEWKIEFTDNAAVTTGGYVTYEGNIAMSGSYGYYVEKNITITEWGENNQNVVECRAVTPNFNLRFNDNPNSTLLVNGTRSNFTTDGLPYNLTRGDQIQIYVPLWSCSIGDVAPAHMTFFVYGKTRCYP